MTGMPTGEVEADPADGVEVADGATALGGSTSVGALPSPPAGGGEPGAASVMKPILRGEPVQALLRGKDPRRRCRCQSSLRYKLKGAILEVV